MGPMPALECAPAAPVQAAQRKRKRLSRNRLSLSKEIVDELMAEINATLHSVVPNEAELEASPPSPPRVETVVVARSEAEECVYTTPRWKYRVVCSQNGEPMTQISLLSGQ